MKRFVAIVPALVIVVLPGCRQEPEIQAERYENPVRVAPGAVEELCFQASKDSEVIYRFEADQPLVFNLHYHIDDETFYPVPEHTTAAEKGRYLVPKDDTYCLMWTNTRDSAVELSVQVDGAETVAWF